MTTNLQGILLCRSAALSVGVPITAGFQARPYSTSSRRGPLAGCFGFLGLPRLAGPRTRELAGARAPGRPGLNPPLADGLPNPNLSRSMPMTKRFMGFRHKSYLAEREPNLRRGRPRDVALDLVNDLCDDQDCQTKISVRSRELPAQCRASQVSG